MAITISERQGVRYLHFGTPWIQGAMRIARPYALELEYTRDLMVPLLLRDGDWPRSVLQVGLGSASITRYLYRFFPSARLTVVEIAPEVIAAARQYFRLPEDEDRLRIEVEDGHAFASRSRAKFDLIVLDGFDEKGRAGMLDTTPFYMLCRERLTRRGVMSVNLLTRTRGVRPSVERLETAFEGRVVTILPSDAGNTVALAAVGSEIEEAFEELRKKARALKAATGLDLMPTLGRLARASSAQDRFLL
jgi:spermidine synthase